MTSTNPSAPAQPGNELYFTRGTKRFARIGDTLRVVTEGATITITLGDLHGQPVTRVGVVVTEPNVVVNKSVRKSARVTENIEPAPAAPQAAAKPAARKVATVVKPAPAKPRAARKVATVVKPAAAK